MHFCLLFWSVLFEEGSIQFLHGLIIIIIHIISIVFSIIIIIINTTKPAYMKYFTQVTTVGQ